MKLNFGTGLITFFALWAIGILFLVYKSSKENIDLVSNDYYNKEVAFQSQIDKEKNVEQLSQPVQVNFNQNNREVTIQFPNDFHSASLEGSIHFFKPDDASKDFNVRIQTDASLVQQIPAAEMKKGLWRAEIDWSSGNMKYYTEKNFNVN